VYNWVTVKWAKYSQLAPLATYNQAQTHEVQVAIASFPGLVHCVHSST